MLARWRARRAVAFVRRWRPSQPRWTREPAALMRAARTAVGTFAIRRSVWFAPQSETAACAARGAARTAHSTRRTRVLIVGLCAPPRSRRRWPATGTAHDVVGWVRAQSVRGHTMGRARMGHARTHASMGHARACDQGRHDRHSGGCACEWWVRMHSHALAAHATTWGPAWLSTGTGSTGTVMSMTSGAWMDRQLSQGTRHSNGALLLAVCLSLGVQTAVALGNY